jgi:hypothetical protein
MARRFPRPLARRDVLYGPETPPEKLVALGHAYLAEDLVFDAADFFCEARDREGLGIIRARAIETGDAFLLRQVQAAMPDLVAKSDWDELALRAADLGKGVYAARAEAGGAPPPLPLQGEEEPAGAGEEGPEEAGEAAKDDASRRRHGGRRRRR